jgi:hypothetical protein
MDRQNGTDRTDMLLLGQVGWVVPGQTGCYGQDRPCDTTGQAGRHVLRASQDWKGRQEGRFNSSLPPLLSMIGKSCVYNNNIQYICNIYQFLVALPKTQSHGNVKTTLCVACGAGGGGGLHLVCLNLYRF